MAVRELMADPKLSLLVLSGGVGTRKSGLACWALSQREGGIYVQADELLPIEDIARTSVQAPIRRAAWSSQSSIEPIARCIFGTSSIRSSPCSCAGLSESG